MNRNKVVMIVGLSHALAKKIEGIIESKKLLRPVGGEAKHKNLVSNELFGVNFLKMAILPSSTHLR